MEVFRFQKQLKVKLKVQILNWVSFLVCPIVYILDRFIRLLLVGNMTSSSAMAERPCKHINFNGVGQFEAKFYLERLGLRTYSVHASGKHGATPTVKSCEFARN